MVSTITIFSACGKTEYRDYRRKVNWSQCSPRLENLNRSKEVIANHLYSLRSVDIESINRSQFDMEVDTHKWGFDNFEDLFHWSLTSHIGISVNLLDSLEKYYKDLESLCDNRDADHYSSNLVRNRISPLYGTYQGFLGTNEYVKFEWIPRISLSDSNHLSHTLNNLDNIFPRSK